MTVKTITNYGFCFGVKSAINKIYDLLKTTKKLYAFGDVIHNPQKMEELKKEGLVVVSTPSAVPDGAVLVLRSHGVSPHINKIARQKKLTLIDTTCPTVKKVHNFAKKLAEEDYFVVIIGDAQHPEVVSILERLTNKDRVAVVSNANEVNILSNILSNKRIGILMQTTQRRDNVREVIDKIISGEQVKELKIYNTLCDVVVRRMSETEELSKEVELMLVVGGKNSANTRGLKEISQKYCKYVYHIEDLSELSGDWLQNKKSIGITAGTSTPVEIVDKIKEYLSRC